MPAPLNITGNKSSAYNLILAVAGDGGCLLLDCPHSGLISQCH